MIFNKSDLNWQVLTVPLSDWSWTNTQFDRIVFRYASNTSHTGIYLDFIQIQSGITQPVPTDAQLLSTNGAAGNISISDGNTIALNVNDADSDPTNELQDLSGLLLKADFTDSIANHYLTELDSSGFRIDVSQVNNALNLDQTTPQEIINGIPLLIADIADFNNSSQLVNVEYVNQALSFIDDFFFDVTASDIGGIYYEMIDAPIAGTLSTFSTSALTTGDDQAIVNFATNSGVPGVTSLKDGIYNGHIHAAVDVITGYKSAQIYFEIYTRTSGGTETLRGTSNVSTILTNVNTPYDLTAVISPSIDIDVTDRIVIKWYTNITGSGADVTVSLYAEDATSSRLSIPTSTSILSSIFIRQDGTKPLTSDWDAGAHDITSDAFITNSGTSSDFVKGDGSLDNSVYLTSEIDGSVTNELQTLTLDSTETTYSITGSINNSRVHWLKGSSSGYGNKFLPGTVFGRNIDVTFADYTPANYDLITILPDDDIAFGDTISLSFNGGTENKIFEYFFNDQDYAIKVVYRNGVWYVLGREAEENSVLGDNTGDQNINIDSIGNVYKIWITAGDTVYINKGIDNATHTGEVTGATTLTIADNVVDYANVDETLKDTIVDNDVSWDMSAHSIVYSAVSGAIGTIAISNAQVNKTMLVVLAITSFTSLTVPAEIHVLNGSATFADGTFYLYIHCIGTNNFTMTIIQEAS
jgi:hypothetical protein